MTCLDGYFQKKLISRWILQTRSPFLGGGGGGGGGGGWGS